MKIKKVLLAVIVAIFAVIGCTSCGAKRLDSDSSQMPTVVVTRPDYGENTKIHIISNVGDERLDISKLEELTNEWISENKDKTIISIEFHFVSQISGNKYGLILIIYRDNNATPTEQ